MLSLELKSVLLENIPFKKEINNFVTLSAMKLYLLLNTSMSSELFYHNCFD